MVSYENLETTSAGLSQRSRSDNRFDLLSLESEDEDFKSEIDDFVNDI